MPPFGFIEFCLSHVDECSGGTDAPAPIVATAARWRELHDVNQSVNALMEISDKDLYGREEIWTYADDRGGDCEDLALEKRRRLIALGWPADAVLLATAWDALGAGHAVLIVTLTDGDYVLDNRAPDIRLWSETHYHWRSRQSRIRPFVWLNVDKTRLAATPAAHYPPLGQRAAFLSVSITASLKKIRPSFPAF